jgi:hypothetical protein
MRGMSKFLEKMIWFSLGLTLCLMPGVSAFAAPREDAVELRVENGDNLVLICRKYIEGPEKWREVAKFNRMKNPSLILPGQTVKIPVGLMRGVPVDGKVTFVYGDAKAQKSEKAEWATLNQGDPVPQGSRIETGKASSVEVTFEDRNSIFLRPETTLGITASEKKGSLYHVNRFYLAVGRVITKLKKATGSDSRIEIETPSAIASVRGTEFRVSADQSASTRTEVLTGTVKVSAMETTVPLNRGEGTYVKKGEAPVTPRKLLSPPKPVNLKPLYKELPLRFACEAMPGLSSVRGILTKDAEGRNILDDKVVAQKESLEFVNIPDGVYYLFLQGIDDLGIEGFSSQPYEVKLRANPLPPLMQLKGDEAEFIGKNPEFKWLKVKDAAAYHIQVALDSSFSVIKEEKTRYEGESFKTGTLDYGVYYFRISSIAADGYEAGWAETPFRLIPPPPAPPLDKPAVSDKEIFLKWRSVGEGITYHFQMAKDVDFKEILVDKKVDKPEVTLEKPKEPGAYHVRTSSIDKKNREGEFSPSQSFEVERGFPYGALGGIGIIGLILFLSL